MCDFLGDGAPVNILAPGPQTSQVRHCQEKKFYD